MHSASGRFGYCIFVTSTSVSSFATMPEGTVKFFHADLGWGFITPDDHSSDIFVHRSCSELSDTAYLLQGTRVLYNLEWDYDRANWRASICTGFKQPAQPSRNTTTTWIKGRRCKHPSTLGLNLHEHSKWVSSSVNSRARRRLKRHPESKVDERDL